MLDILFPIRWEPHRIHTGGGGGGLGGGISKPPAWQSNPHSQAHQLSKTPGIVSYAKARAAKGAAKVQREGRVSEKTRGM